MIQENEIRLRWEDEQECAASGMTPVQALMNAVSRSTMSFTSEYNNEVVAYWGLTEDCVIAGRASVWVLSTPAMDRYPRWAARESLWLLAALMDTHYHLRAVVDMENARAVRWLEWLGFDRGTKNGKYMEMNITRGGAA